MSAQDGTPRTVHLPVVIRTWGEFCHPQEGAEACPRLYGERGGQWCGLFGVHLLSHDEDDDGTDGPPESASRCPACLALDAPAPDLSPEDVVRHDFGSQP